MILYDNKSILSLSCKYHGSVFPKAALGLAFHESSSEICLSQATLIALPFVIAVMILKALVQAEQISWSRRRGSSPEVEDILL